MKFTTLNSIHIITKTLCLMCLGHLVGMCAVCALVDDSFHIVFAAWEAPGDRDRSLRLQQELGLASGTHDLVAQRSKIL